MDAMVPIEIDALPQWSEWPARLLGLAQWDAVHRTVEKVDQEYDKDKYARCLRHYLDRGSDLTAEEIKRFEFTKEPDDKVCISLDDTLFEATLRDARDRSYRLLRDTLGPEIHKCRTVVELGAGYGYNLWMLKQHFPSVEFIGGEYSENAVRLASYLYEDEPTVQVRHFNFRDQAAYQFLDEATSPVLLFTSHAIEQLQTAAPVLDYLSAYRRKLLSVFCFEPIHALQGETLLGLLRRRYIEANDYNRDLMPCLWNQQSIRLLQERPNVFGFNPLNPTSIIEWRFLE